MTDIQIGAAMSGAGGDALSLSDMALAPRSDTTEIGGAIRSQLDTLRKRSGEAVDIMNATETIVPGNSAYSDAVDALRAPVAAPDVFGDAGGRGGMPEGSDIGQVMDRYARMTDSFAKMSHTSMLFTMGATVTTKVDGSTKMFIQAQ